MITQAAVKQDEEMLAVRDQAEPAMTKTEYENTMHQLTMLARLIRQLPLKRMVELQEHSATFGCFVDPTLWVRGIDNLRAVQKLCQALYECQGKLDQLVRDGR